MRKKLSKNQDSQEQEEAKINPNDWEQEEANLSGEDNDQDMMQAGKEQVFSVTCAHLNYMSLRSGKNR